MKRFLCVSTFCLLTTNLHADLLIDDFSTAAFTLQVDSTDSVDSVRQTDLDPGQVLFGSRFVELAVTGSPAFSTATLPSETSDSVTLLQTLGSSTRLTFSYSSGGFGLDRKSFADEGDRLQIELLEDPAEGFLRIWIGALTASREENIYIADIDLDGSHTYNVLLEDLTPRFEKPPPNFNEVFSSGFSVSLPDTTNKPVVVQSFRVTVPEPATSIFLLSLLACICHRTSKVW